MIHSTPQDTPPTEAAMLPTGHDEPSGPPAEWNHDTILTMTADVFPGAKIELGTGIDPEIEDDEYFVVSVTTPGEVNELVARERHWHQRLRALAGASTRFYRLNLDVA